jgi:hypothetical protein
MQKVEGSNPFIRSICVQVQGDVAEWLGTGLQNPLHRFNSGRRLLRRSCNTPFSLSRGERGEAGLLSSAGGVLLFLSAIFEYPESKRCTVSASLISV